MKKKFLILGGSGFIGTNFINYLSLFQSNIIFNVDKISKESTTEKFKKIKFAKNYFFYKFNLTNQKKLSKLIIDIKPDLIINFAAESHVDRSLDSPKFFFLNNIHICISLAEACRQLKKNFKIFHISTDEVFGDIKNGKVNEQEKLKPTSPYSTSKSCSDLILRSYSDVYNFKLTTIQMCNNYGPYQFPEKFIPTAINCLINKKKIPIYGNGKNIREWIYVEDACKAIYKLSLLKRPKKSYNLGSNIRVDNLKLASILIKIFFKNKVKKNKHFLFTKDRLLHDKRYALSSEVAKKDIGNYVFNFLDKGLKKTISWYLGNLMWLKVCNKKYQGQRQGLKVFKK
jgi:dTDP-glucose 4,6-dehydratase